MDYILANAENAADGSGLTPKIYQSLISAGIDGITLSWVDYKSGLSQFESDILPLMREAGLRQ